MESRVAFGPKEGVGNGSGLERIAPKGAAREGQMPIPRRKATPVPWGKRSLGTPNSPLGASSYGFKPRNLGLGAPRAMPPLLTCAVPHGLEPWSPWA